MAVARSGASEMAWRAPATSPAKSDTKESSWARNAAKSAADSVVMPAASPTSFRNSRTAFRSCSSAERAAVICCASSSTSASTSAAIWSEIPWFIPVSCVGPAQRRVRTFLIRSGSCRTAPANCSYVRVASSAFGPLPM